MKQVVLTPENSTYRIMGSMQVLWLHILDSAWQLCENTHFRKKSVLNTIEESFKSGLPLRVLLSLTVLIGP